MPVHNNMTLLNHLFHINLQDTPAHLLFFLFYLASCLFFCFLFLFFCCCWNNVEAHASVPPHSYAPGHVQKYAKFNQVMGSQLSLLLSTCFLNSLTGITNDHGYVPLVVNTSQSFPHLWIITGFVTRLTRQVPLVEQDLLTLLEHLSLPPVFSGVRVIRYLVLCVCFVDRCLSFCPFSFDHCAVCPSIYGFWLPLWCLQTPLKPVTFLWFSQSQDLDFNHHMLWSFFLCSVS